MGASTLSDLQMEQYVKSKIKENGQHITANMGN